MSQPNQQHQHESGEFSGLPTSDRLEVVLSAIGHALRALDYSYPGLRRQIDERVSQDAIETETAGPAIEAVAQPVTPVPAAAEVVPVDELEARRRVHEAQQAAAAAYEEGAQHEQAA